MKKKKGWIRLSEEIRTIWIKDSHYKITDGQFTIGITSSLWLENTLPGKIVVRERYYRTGDSESIILKTKDKTFTEKEWYSEKHHPVLLNGRPIVRILTYDPTGSVRDYRINPKRLTINK